MNERIKDVSEAIIDAIRKVLTEKEVSEAEYYAGVGYLISVAETKETGLLCDVFFNSTIVAANAAKVKSSTPAIQGPYFLEGAPVVDGKLKTYDTDDHQPLIIRGVVLDDAGQPIKEAVVDIWHSTPDGLYSGIVETIPNDYYRGKVLTDATGHYSVRTTMPVPYQIPDQGPTGALLIQMGTHSWRPAHVHFKVRKEGHMPLTTQYYFEGGEWVDDDCCNGVESALIVPKVFEDGARVMNLDFAIERVKNQPGQAAPKSKETA